MVRDKDDGLLPSEADPKKIHAYAVKQRFHPYFQVMQNTAELFGIDEPALKDDAEFQWDKVIKLFLADHCSEGPLQMLTQPSSKLPFLHTFSHLLEETFLKHEDISEGEKKAWRLAASKGVL